MTTALILVPLGGALWVWITPWRTTRAPGGLALLIALAELALWIGTAFNLDFSDRRPQFETQQTWFADLGVSYHVGLEPFTLWLAGMTILVSAAAIGYGFWSGRDRPAATHIAPRVGATCALRQRIPATTELCDGPTKEGGYAASSAAR